MRNNQIYYLHNDHSGRPQLATNSTQQVVWKANTTAFDRTVTQDAIGGLNLGFPGQYWDAESSLWHNGYREYWAETGRYLQSDPIGLAGGVNTYAYVSGNPVGLVDPLGLEGVGPWTFPPGPQRDAYMAAQNGARGPDFVQLSASICVFGGSVTLSRSGNVFVSGGIGRAYPNPVRGLGVSLNAGNLMSSCPVAKERGAKTDKFLTGLGYSATAHDIIGGGAAYSPGSGGAVLYGVGAGVEVSPGSVGAQTPWSLPGW